MTLTTQGKERATESCAPCLDDHIHTEIIDTIKTYPFVSVVMPIRNEVTWIERGLSAILAQDYPADRMEVIVVDGMSDDGTRTVVQSFAVQHSHIAIRILDNPAHTVPAALNIGLRAACGSVIVRVDGHTVIAPDYISEGIALLLRTKADNVGGLMTAVGQGWIGETIAIAHELRFGLGGGLFHRATKETEADTVYMGIFRRDVFDRVGIFDEEMTRNQDIELNGRIRQAGGRIILSPRIRSVYHCRDSLRALWKQNYANGIWLFPTITKTPQALSVRHYIPLAFVASLLLSGIAALRLHAGRILFAVIAGSYVVATGGASISASARHGRRFLVSLPLVFVTLHVSYGLGSLVGLYQKIVRGIGRRFTASEI